MDCKFQYVRQISDKQHLIHCPVCKQAEVSPYPNPELVRKECASSKACAVRKPPPPPKGPGTELIALNKELGFDACGLCKDTAKKMDAGGPDWCVEHREALAIEIASNFELIASGVAKQIDALDAPPTPKQLELIRAGKLRVLTDGQKIERKGKLATMLAKAAMMTKGVAHAAMNLAAGQFVPDPTDRIGSLIDEAIRRARAAG